MNGSAARVPSFLLSLIKFYLLNLAVYFIFRLILFFLQHQQAAPIPFNTILSAFFMGLRFDLVITGYLAAIPAALYLVTGWHHKTRPTLSSFSYYYLLIVSIPVLFIHSADIPWYNHTQSRLTVAALQWTDSPAMMLKIVFQDPFNYPYLALFFLLLLLFARLLKKIILKNKAIREKPGSLLHHFLFSIIFCALLFLGIRGRIAIKSPIRWGTAFTTSHNLTNQAGLNPAYTFFRSWLDKQAAHHKPVQYYNPEQAGEVLKKSFYPHPILDSVSPVARHQHTSGPAKQYNVVLILMEGMSAKNMTRFGNPMQLTPCLDSLYHHSLAFNNFYSDGIHTFNGVYSSITGFPSLPLVHHMKDLQNQQPYFSIARLLKKHGYQNTFYTTHDEQFDNMAGFLLPNGFDNITAQKDFPPHQVLSTLGVPDHILFDRVITDISSNNWQSPFFIAVLTGSNHGPYVLPKDIPFVPGADGLENKLIEYSDWALCNFLEKASQHDWFDSTLFVITADHGALGSAAERHLAFHHIPFIIYAPSIITQPVVSDKIGAQYDIPATISALLNIAFLNNTLGVNLLDYKHDFIVFTYDEELCGLSENHLWINSPQSENQFTISADGLQAIPISPNEKTNQLKIYSLSAMQVIRDMIKNKKMN